GLGYTFEIDVNEVIVDKSLSIHKGALAPLGRYKESWVFEVLKAVAKKYDFTLKTPIEKIPDEHLNILLFGDEEPIPLTVQYGSYGARNYKVMYSGLFNFLEDHTGHHNLDKGNVDDYRRKIRCPTCKGARLKKESLFFRDRKSTRLNSSHVSISYAVFCLKKKIKVTSLY